MNKKYIIAIVVAVIAICGAFWFGRRSAIAPEEQRSVPNEEMEQATTTPVAASSKTASKATSGTTSGTPTAPVVTPTAPLMTKNGAYIISYTDKGFVPATLEIKAGKSVHFVNNSNKAMSLTSIDQNSQVYREFNQVNSVGRGGSYDFTFLSAGTWWYVNRNSQKELGTIIVK